METYHYKAGVTRSTVSGKTICSPLASFFFQINYKSLYFSLSGVANSEALKCVLFLFLSPEYDVVNDIQENNWPNFASELTPKFSGQDNVSPEELTIQDSLFTSFSS